MINKDYCKNCKKCKAATTIKEPSQDDPEVMIEKELPPDRSCASFEARNSRDFSKCTSFEDSTKPSKSTKSEE